MRVQNPNSDGLLLSLQDNLCTARAGLGRDEGRSETMRQRWWGRRGLALAGFSLVDEVELPLEEREAILAVVNPPELSLALVAVCIESTETAVVLGYDAVVCGVVTRDLYHGKSARTVLWCSR